MRQTHFFLAILALFLASCNLPTANMPLAAESTPVQTIPTPFQPSRQAALGFFRNLPAPTNLPIPIVQEGNPVMMPTLQPLGSPTPSASGDLINPTVLPEGMPTATTQPLPTVQINMEDPTILNLPDTVTFLLLGSDTRGGASFRTDTILIVILRPKDGNVSIISVPRDLWVNIPMVGEQRINVAYQYGDIYDYPGGGAGILKDTILYNLGVQIDHVAMVDFNGFRKIVDTIGGVDIPVYCPYTDWRMIDPSLDPELEESWQQYTVQPGIVHMDGDLALWYARSRKMSNDFDRGRRQQEVLRALFQQSIKANLLTRIPQLYVDLSSSYTTDLGVADLLTLAPLAFHLSNANIRGYYIAGDYVTDWITDMGAYILLPNTEKITAMIQEAMLPSSRPQEKQKVRVEVLNGSAVIGLDRLAAERLNYAGFDTIVSEFDRHDYPSTLVYSQSATPDAQVGATILNSLGLEASNLIANPKPDPKTSYAVIIGNDYDACFDPSESINQNP